MKAIIAFILADVSKGLAISSLHANAGTRAFDAAIPVLLVAGDAVALFVALYNSSGRINLRLCLAVPALMWSANSAVTMHAHVMDSRRKLPFSRC